MINKYNNILSNIVLEFVKKLYIEEGIEETVNFYDFDIMEYKGVLGGPVELWDRYISINDILTCIANNFTAKSVLDYYDYTLDLRTKKKEVIYNYYNFIKYNINSKEYEEKEKQSLKEGKKKLIYLYLNLINLFTGLFKIGKGKFNKIFNNK